MPHFQSIVLNSNRCTTHDTPPARPSRAPKNPSPHTAPDARAHVVSRVAHRARACPTRVPITHPITRIPSHRARASTTTPPTALSRDGARDLSQSRDTGDHRTIDASKPMTRALDSTRLDSSASVTACVYTAFDGTPLRTTNRTDMYDSRALNARVGCALVVCARERPVARRESSRAGSLNPILIHTPRRAVGLLWYIIGVHRSRASALCVLFVCVRVRISESRRGCGFRPSLPVRCHAAHATVRAGL